MAEINVGHSDILSITIGDYAIQRLDQTATGMEWVQCHTRKYPGSNQFDTMEAVYADVTDAEERLNKFRDDCPHNSFRLTRKMTITEVVHA